MQLKLDSSLKKKRTQLVSNKENQFHIGFLGYVIFPKAVDYNMYMDIAAFVMTVCMCAD